MPQPTPDHGALSDAERFLVELARDLHRFGTPAHRLEEQVSRCGARLGVPTTMFSLPTFLALAFGPLDRQRVVNVRVDPGSTDLGRLHAMEGIQRRVLSGEISPSMGAASLRELGTSPPAFNQWFTWAAYGLSAMAATRFFGGDVRDAVAGAIVGLLVGGLSLVFGLFTQQVERMFLRRHKFLERDAPRFHHISALLFQLLELVGYSLLLANALLDFVCGVLHL